MIKNSSRSQLAHISFCYLWDLRFKEAKWIVKIHKTQLAWNWQTYKLNYPFEPNYPFLNTHNLKIVCFNNSSNHPIVCKFMTVSWANRLICGEICDDLYVNKHSMQKMEQIHAWIAVWAKNLCLLPLKLTSMRSQLNFVKPLIIASTAVNHEEKVNNKKRMMKLIIKMLKAETMQCALRFP